MAFFFTLIEYIDDTVTALPPMPILHEEPLLRPDIQSCVNYISQIIKGKDQQIILALTCMLGGGHLLIEDLPGMGKTTLSHCLANTYSLQFSRIQFTSDLLPADILGVNIFDTERKAFAFHQGPIFNQVVLADEINRASPKTQSALLEAMAEQQITVDGETHTLPSPFFVIATQNPSFQSGTHALPESQIDRFMMRLSLGYPDMEAEKLMLRNTAIIAKHNDAMLTPEQLLRYQQRVKKVNVSDDVIHYILRLVQATREHGRYPHALSPRATKALYTATQAAAFIKSRDYATPDDVQYVLPAVVEHRLRGTDTHVSNKHSYSELLLEQIDPLAAA